MSFGKLSYKEHKDVLQKEILNNVKRCLIKPKAHNVSTNFPTLATKALWKTMTIVMSNTYMFKEDVEFEPMLPIIYYPPASGLLNKHLVIIDRVAKIMDCKAVCVDRVNPYIDISDPIKSITIMGYMTDAGIAYALIDYLITPLGYMQYNQQKKYRDQKAKLRRTNKTRYIDSKTQSRTKASKDIDKAIDIILNELEDVLRMQPTTPGWPKKESNIEKKTMEYFTLDYAYPNALTKKFLHATIKSGYKHKKILNYE